MLAREPASFWRENVIAVVLLLRSFATIRPFIRGKIRRVLNKTRTFRINGTFRLKFKRRGLAKTRLIR